MELVHASVFARPGGFRAMVVSGETMSVGGVRGVGAFGSKDAENGDAGSCNDGVVEDFGGGCGVPLRCRSATSPSTSVDRESLVSRLAMTDSHRRCCSGMVWYSIREGEEGNDICVDSATSFSQMQCHGHI